MLLDLGQSAAQGAGTGVGQDSTPQSFDRDVIEASKTRLVLVDFWAPWCGPCATLTPLLETVVAESAGQVSLVKINMDDYPELGQALGVRSLPTVFLFEGGQPVDGFMGALGLGAIKDFLAKNGLSLKPHNEMLDLGHQARAHHDYAGAIGFYGAALGVNPDDQDALLGLCRSYGAVGDRVKAVLYSQKLSKETLETPDGRAFQGHLALLDDLEKARPFDALMAVIAQDACAFDALYEIALYYFVRGEENKAMDALLHIIAKDRQAHRDAARSRLLQFFDILGFDNPRVQEGRKRLSTLLFC